MELTKFAGKRICVAVSGGADSVALLHYLRAQESDCGFLLSAVHCEHGIRGKASLKDRYFVEELCKAWQIPLSVFSENCLLRQKEEKESLETVARNFRKECFERLIKEDKADYIATAHHIADETETVLFRLARGTSLTGGRGMREEDGYILRPFLYRSKEEILAYCKAHKLSFRTDKTNFKADATRNKLRLKVLPYLKKIFPFFEKNLARFSYLAGEDDKYLYELSSKLVSHTDKEIHIAFCKEKPLFFRASLTAIKSLGVEKDYTLSHIESVYLLQEKERGKRVCLPQGVRAEKRENCIAFFKEKENKKEPCFEQVPFTKNGFDGGRYAVKIEKNSQNSVDTWQVLRFDEEKMPKDAVFRFRKDGDYIKAFSGHTKSLKKLFNERKIPKDERAFLPVIASENGSEVYCVCGVEISEKIKVTDTTQKTAYIILQQ